MGPRQHRFKACFAGYPTLVENIDHKHKQAFEELKEFDTTYNEHNIILDLYDGSQMVNNAKRKINVISFSSQIFNERSIRQIGSTAASGSIMKWMQ